MPEQKFSPIKQSLILKILVILAYLSVFFFLIPWGWYLIWFIVGVICGVGFLLGDERVFANWYCEQPTDQFLVSRSPIFLLSLIPIAIFVVTSSGSFWASGLIGSMILFLLLEMLEFRKDPLIFDKRFLQGIKGQVSVQAINLILLIGWLFFIMVHLLMVY